MVPNCVPKNEEPRIPRKKGQPAGSDKHSDLYTDENPKGTIQGLGFKDVDTAKASVNKIKSSGKKHAHKIQAAIAMEQRAKEMGKTAEAAVYRSYIEKMKKKTKEMEENLNELSSSINWINSAITKISQIIHPKGWDNIVKTYVDGMKDDEHRKHPSKWAVDVSKRYRDIDSRALIKYINTLVSKGKIPKELKAEYQMEKYTFSDLIKSIDEVKQDKEIKDKEGTQPAKYYAGDMAKSTKDKRDAHFKAKKSSPAPGDATAKTKPSVHTKKFKQMFGELSLSLRDLQKSGLTIPRNEIDKLKKELAVLRINVDKKVSMEVLDKDADAGDYIDDFAKSDAPQFKGKSKEKRKDMAVAAYLSKKDEAVSPAQQAAIAISKKERGEKPRKEAVISEKIEGLANKAEKSGMPYSILKKVYDRGMAAWKTGHRPGTTPQQWAFARVNSFVTKSSGTWGKADADLAKQVRGESVVGESLWDNIRKKKARIAKGSGEKMRSKGDRGAPTPNQIKRASEDLNEWGEVTEKDDKSGKELNNPTRGDVKKYKVYVRNDKGNVVKVEFGDPNMSIKRDDPARRKAFRARHNCDQKKDKTTAGYWSCKFWSTKSVTDLMKG